MEHGEGFESRAHRVRTRCTLHQRTNNRSRFTRSLPREPSPLHIAVLDKCSPCGSGDLTDPAAVYD